MLGRLQHLRRSPSATLSAVVCEASDPALMHTISFCVMAIEQRRSAFSDAASLTYQGVRRVLLRHDMRQRGATRSGRAVEYAGRDNATSICTIR